MNKISPKKISFSEENIQKQLQFKEQISKSSDDLPFVSKFEKEPTFKYFFIIGFEFFSQIPSILAMFPSRPPNLTNYQVKDIIDYCYPCRCEKIEQSSEQQNNIIAGFVFNFVQDDKLLYGTVLQISIPKSNRHIGSKFDHSCPFCLCIISKYADISSHFSFLCEINNLILSNKPSQSENEIDIPSELQNQTGDLLPTLVLDTKTPLIAVSPNIFSLHFLFHKLLKYYTYNFIPTLKRNYYLLYPTMQTLFTFLSVEQIVKVYAYILLEKKILFLSKKLNRLSFCVLAASNLIKRLSIDAKIFPIFPASAEHNDYFDMPFSSIFGYPLNPTEKDKTFFSEKFDLIIDLNKGQILKEAQIPPLPHMSLLIKSINDLIANKRSELRILPNLSIEKIIEAQKVTPDFVLFKGCKNESIYPKCFQYFAETKYVFTPEIIQSILEMLYRIPFTFSEDVTLAEKILPCIVTDTTNSENPLSVFNHGLFLTLLEEDDTRPFLEQFSNTQIFSLFADKIVDDFQNDKSPTAARARSITKNSLKIESIKRGSQSISRAKSNTVKPNFD